MDAERALDGGGSDPQTCAEKIPRRFRYWHRGGPEAVTSVAGLLFFFVFLLWRVQYGVEGVHKSRTFAGKESSHCSPSQ